MSCYDIVRGEVSRDEFLDLENRYLSAIHRIVAGRPVQAKGLEKWDEEGDLLRRVGLDDVLTDELPPVDDEAIEGTRLDNIVRRCLRESAWMELGIVGELAIHFGYDLRLFVVGARDHQWSCVGKEIRSADRLFVYDSRERETAMWQL